MILVYCGKTDYFELQNLTPIQFQTQMNNYNIYRF
jgi:hypothetical protein